MEGIQAKQHEMVLRSYENGIDINLIAQIVEIDVLEVKNIINKLPKKESS